MMNLRIGSGVDFHKFSDENGSFMLKIGGVEIPHSKKLSAHSDGDLLIHAICDAIFGAIGNGNIGLHFSNKDDRWKGKNSTHFLQYAMELLGVGKIINVDCTIIGEEPKIMPHSGKIKAYLAPVLGIDESRVGIKAVTPESMGALGRKEGLGCLATILLTL